MRKWSVLFLSLFFLCCLTICASADEMEMVFFNAGKADACLLRTKNSTVLIDAGKNKFGKELVSYLNEQGITKIDALFITHFDKDHVGGADRVLETVNVHQVYEPAYASDSKQYIQYRKALDAVQTSCVSLEQNMTLELDGVSYLIDVANQSFYGDNEENDFSLVISIRHGDNTFLMAGDAENPRLSELIAEGVGEHDLLKVPHHGRMEKLSAAFFDAVKPLYSVVTSDDEEPEEEGVMKMLQRYGSVYLTREGTVTVVSDGKTLSINQ